MNVQKAMGTKWYTN